MQILDTRIVYRDGNYVSFPNLALLKDGTIMCAFRHAPSRVEEFGSIAHPDPDLDPDLCASRQAPSRVKKFGGIAHLDPDAKDVFVYSHDGGKTFEQEPHTILDEEMVSNQDPCLTVLSNGRILSSSYRWIFAPIGEGPAVWGEKRYKHCGQHFFNKYDAFIGDANCSYSDDNGKTWTFVPRLYVEGTPCGVAVRGNVLELPNGDLLMPYYNKLAFGQLSSAGLFRSTDFGETWEDYSTIAPAAPDKNFFEPNIFRTRSGRLVALIRTQTDPSVTGARYDSTYLNVHTTVSEDDGKTWGPVTEVENFWGSNPIHALQLKSGKVLVTYGYRRAPFGIRARLCNAELTDLSEAEEIILRSDAPHGDLGYTNAIQLDNGDILVTYYIADENDTRVIAVTRLRED